MLSKWITTTIAAAISAYACGVVAQYGTPIDSALPLIAVIVTIAAAVSTAGVQLAVPLLILGEIAIPDERLRLLWFGVVIGCAFAAALLFAATFPRAATLTVCAIVLLRWIPLTNVTIWREALLIGIALLIVYVLHATPAGVAIAAAVALFTPLIPLRTLIFPMAVLIVLALLRAIGMPELRATVAASFAMGVMLLFFAWSGVFARALPVTLGGFPVNGPREPMRMALAPGETIVVEAPPGASAVILSGANIARLRAGTLVGSIDRIPLRVGDVADWGFLRRDQFYASNKAIPVNPAGVLRGYGQSAWIDGAARFPIPRGARRIVITADRGLPREARLQIDAFELVSQ